MASLINPLMVSLTSDNTNMVRLAPKVLLIPVINDTLWKNNDSQKYFTDIFQQNQKTEIR